AMCVTSSIFSYFQGFLMSGVTAKATRKFRMQISEKINKLPLKYFDTQTHGDILSRITNDVDTIGQTLNQSLSSIVKSVTMFIGALVMMFVNSWQLTLITLAALPISLLFVMILVKISQKYFIQQQKSLGELNGIIEENYSAHNIVKTFNAEVKAQLEFEMVNKSLKTSSFKSQFLSGTMHPVMHFINNIVYVLICVVGGILAIDNPLFAVTIVAFIQYMRIFNQQISQVSQISGTLQSAAAASERVFEFLFEEEQELELDNKKKLKDIIGKVEFKNVCFGYDKEKTIIKNFSAVIEPGQKIAIVGPTGAGKTTIVNLLMRFYEIEEGDILIDGISIKDMKREDVRALFGMVLQDTWIFDGTIRENISYGTPNKTKEEIEDACCFAHIDHFIRSLPNGYDMYLDETANISQGQRQLLTIARAMVNNAPMLILDEATSSVDTRTEIQIQKAMDKLTEGRTSFVIAHRLSTIKNADQILVMKDGNIIEQGNHQTLLSQNGFYAELYNSQFAE
ncbi:MAG: ABC transporter ATP-binding protein, partial [Clostridia bacterium]|nr:ABC transporter ATP-binding protein [Clostridia bacterium]